MIIYNSNVLSIFLEIHYLSKKIFQYLDIVYVVFLRPHLILNIQFIIFFD